MVFLSQNFSGRLWEFASRLLDNGVADLPSEPGQETTEELEMMVNASKQEWLNAQSYFNQATESELVDHG